MCNQVKSIIFETKIKPMRILSRLIPILFIASLVIACNSKEKNEDAAPARELSPVEKAKYNFVAEVEKIHKKEKFLSEDRVSYEISYTLGKWSDVLQVKAATDLSLVEISSKKVGKTYYDGQQLYLDAMANMGDREAQRNFLMVYFYHAFFHLSETTYELSNAEVFTKMEKPYKKITIQNNGFHTAFFPKKVEFYVEDRTQMLKGLALQTSLLSHQRSKEAIELHYERFITVNHVPVPLTWKFYPSSKTEESDLLGEAQITRIKYSTAQQMPLSIPENAKAIKNSPIL